MSKSNETADSSLPDEKSKGNRRLDAIADTSRSVRDQLTGQLKTLDSKRALDAVLEAPKRLKREWQKTGATGAITKFPIPTILVFLLLTVYFVTQSGFLDGTNFDACLLYTSPSPRDS